MNANTQSVETSPAGRALRLYSAAIKAMANRLRLDFGRELTVLIASSVLFATFFYVFNDFLNVQVSTLSRPMRDRFAEVAATVVLILATAIAARAIRAERIGERGFALTARALGEEPAVVRAFLLARAATILALTHGAAWYVAWRYLAIPAPPTVRFGVALAMIAGSSILALVPERARRQDSSQTRELATLEHLVGTVAAWRLRQILFGNRPARLCMSLAVAFSLLAAWASFRAAPPFVAVAASLAAGLVAATTLAFQMAEDLATAWTERAFGVSHAQFIGAYEKVGALIGAICAALVFALVAPSTDPLIALKAAACAAIPPLTAPLLLLQIDGRRPAVNVMLIVIVGLFIGTAVFAHWLSLGLLLVLRHYALQSQAGRFYRA